MGHYPGYQGEPFMGSQVIHTGEAEEDLMQHTQRGEGVRMWSKERHSKCLEWCVHETGGVISHWEPEVPGAASPQKHPEGAFDPPSTLVPASWN